MQESKPFFVARFASNAALFSCLACLPVLLAGCGGSPSSPSPRPSIERTVERFSQEKTEVKVVGARSSTVESTRTTTTTKE